MKKDKLKLPIDLIWNIKREAKKENKPIPEFLRELLDFWEKSQF